jgi:hypothetical protein
MYVIGFYNLVNVTELNIYFYSFYAPQEEDS